MNHTFLSQQSEIDREQELRDLLLDVQKIVNVSSDNQKLIQRRREADVKEDDLREVLERRGNRLGHLIDDIERLSGCELPNEQKEWEKFCNGESIIMTTLDGMLRDNETAMSKLGDMEWNISESSLSDYSDSSSDSDNNSSDDDEEDDEEDDDEEDDEEDDD